MEILTPRSHPKLWRKAAVRKINKRLCSFVLDSREIFLGTGTIRNSLCHLAEGPYEPGTAYLTHQHGDIQMEAPLFGDFDFIVNKRRARLKPGDLLVIPPMVPHSWSTTTGGLMLGIHTKCSLAIKSKGGLVFSSAPRGLILRDDLLVLQVRRLLGLACKPKISPIESASAASLLEALLAHALAGTAKQPTRQPGTRKRTNEKAVQMVDHIRDFIASNLTRPLGTDEIARQSSMSLRHLSRIFSDLTGETLHQCVLRMRLERARQMLENDALLPVKAAAYECGFNSPSHLHMAFKKQFGFAPGRLVVEAGK